MVIGGIAAVGAAVGALGVLFANTGAPTLYALFFLLGAATMPLYALCIVNAGENTDLTLVEVTSGILIVNSAGSILGPIIVALLMEGYGPQSYFTYSLVCLLLAALWAFYRRFVVERTRDPDVHAEILPRTTHAVAELSSQEMPSDREPDGTSQ
jgi:MFS family permease